MTDNSGKAIQKYRVYIKATPQAVWDALTKPEWSVRYGYPNTHPASKRGSWPPPVSAISHSMALEPSTFQSAKVQDMLATTV
jgi:hypothetical protein